MVPRSWGPRGSWDRSPESACRILCLQEVACFLVGDAQGCAGVQVLRSYPKAAMQDLHDHIELAEVHIAEAQVVAEIGIVGVLAEELLQR